MRQTAIQFASDKLTLEGVLSVPDGLSVPLPAMVVCHPHPLLGGDMENPVRDGDMPRGKRARHRHLRFNFRGAGGSEGEFSKGKRSRETSRRRWTC